MSGVEWTVAEREAVEQAVRPFCHLAVVQRVATVVLNTLAPFVAAREAQAAARALREAERVWQTSAWIDVLDGSTQQRIGHAQQVTEWLHQRANLLDDLRAALEGDR